jgi:hypothetical protein
MQKIFLILFLFANFIFADYLDISLSQNQKRFENVIFDNTDYHYLLDDNGNEDTSKPVLNDNATKKYTSDENYQMLKIDGYYNEMVGFSYQNDSRQDVRVDRQEVYLGSPELKFFSYATGHNDVVSDDKYMSNSYYEYTFLTFLTIKNDNFHTSYKEQFKKYEDGSDVIKDVTLHRKYNLEIRTLSSENFYEKVKDDAINKEDYIYPIAIAKNFTSNFRVYGIIIASIEQYDYSKGESYYYGDVNGTISKINMYNDDNQYLEKLVCKDARYKGYGFGYKITFEIYEKNISYYLTSYEKTIKLENQYEPNAEGVYSANVWPITNFNFKERYLTLGVRYRF